MGSGINSEGAAEAARPAAERDPLKLENLVLLGVFLAVLLASVMLTPSPVGVSFLGVEIPSTCMFRSVTGIPCPGCGLTRSFVFMGHAQIVDAFRLHLLGPLLYLVVLQQGVARTLRLARALIRRWRGGGPPPR